MKTTFLLLALSLSASAWAKGPYVRCSSTDQVDTRVPAVDITLSWAFINYQFDLTKPMLQDTRWTKTGTGLDHTSSHYPSGTQVAGIFPLGTYGGATADASAVLTLTQATAKGNGGYQGRGTYVRFAKGQIESFAVTCEAWHLEE